MTDRRASPRLPASRRRMMFQVRAPGGATLAYGMMGDASRGGVGLLTARPCPAGPAVLVPLPRHPLAGRCFAFRVERSGPLRGGGAYLAGRFTPAVPDDVARALAEAPARRPRREGADTQLGPAYARLLEMNHQAMSAGRYGLAHHLLEAAACYADALADEARLEEVARLAREQGARVDEHAPSDRLSSASAAARGNRGVFESCAMAAEALRARLLAERASREAKRALGEPPAG